MMSSALELMRRKLPQDTRLGVLLRPSTVEIYESNPLWDEIIPYPYKSGSPFYGLRELRQKIISGGYNSFLSLDRRPRGAVAALLAGIKERIGPDIIFEGSKKEFWTKFLFSKTLTITAEECSGSCVEMFQLVARRAYGLEGKGKISLPPPQIKNNIFLENFLASVKKPLIGLCIKTNDPRKTWPLEGFATLIKKMNITGASIYITGAPEDNEYIEKLIALVPNNPPVNLAGKTSLMDTYALASKSDLFIGLDNATAHLAANSGLKNIICLLLLTTPQKIIDSMPEAKFFQLALRTEELKMEKISKEAENIFKTVKDMLNI